MAALVRRRVLGAMILMGGLGLGCLGMAVGITFAVALEVPAAFSAVAIFGIAGVVFTLAGFGRATLATCPGCGKGELSFDTPEPGTRAMCRGCGHWAIIEGEQALPLSESTIDHAYPFAFDVAGAEALPEICAACGAAATRTVDLQKKDRLLLAKAAVLVGGVVAGDPTVLVGGGWKARAGVPHCDAHDDGAQLVEHQSAPALRVKSYAFYLGTAGLNRLFQPIARVKPH
jgi:hypothetical protein